MDISHPGISHLEISECAGAKRPGAKRPAPLFRYSENPNGGSMIRIENDFGDKNQNEMKQPHPMQLNSYAQAETQRTRK